MIGTDEEYLANADECERESFFRYKAEVDELRNIFARLEPLTLEEQLRSADKETKILARHFNKQLATFRAEQNSPAADVEQ
jgi:hypothetical protein